MKKTNEKGIDALALIRHAALGAAWGIALTIVVIFIFAAVLIAGRLPSSLMDPFIIVSVIIGTALSGAYCAKKQGGGVITAGVSTAAVYVLLLLIGSMMFGQNSTEAPLTLELIIAALAGGIFGGVLKLNKKRKKSKLRK